VAALLVGLLLVAGAVAWWVSRAKDPFARLEEHDGSHEISEPAAASVAPGASVTEQFRQLDEQLRAAPRDPALLAAKIHLGLESAPSVAAEECRRILAESPRNYFALHHAAMAYLAMTNLDRALHYAGAALQVRDTPEARFVAGHVFYARGDFPNALKHYRAVLALNPSDTAVSGFIAKTDRAMAAAGATTNFPKGHSIGVK
jgi:tetratricopeptide (TPR) repeat protein